MDGVTLSEFGLEFGFGDKLAPRVGFAYDINGDGRWKAFGSWGVFYDIFKLELPRGSFGGDKWTEYYYTLDTFNWPTLVDSPSCPPACPGRLFAHDRLPAHLGRVETRSTRISSRCGSRKPPPASSTS